MRNCATFILTVVLAACLISGPVGGKTIVIQDDGSGDEADIQAGITAAVDGDTVMLTNGFFTGTGNYDIDFMNRAIVVTSENGPSVTTIDCESNGRAFLFQSGEGPGSVLSNLTITNGLGYPGNGGAILCNASSPTIDGNIIVANSSPYGHGGGIYCDTGADAVIVNNIFDNNSGDWGGAVAMLGSSPEFSNNTVKNHVSNKAAVSMRNGSNPMVTHNLFENNGGNEGGALFVQGSAPTIEWNTFYGNSAWTGGGIQTEIYFGGPLPMIRNNTFSENGAGSGLGAAIYVENQNPIIEKNIIAFSTDGTGVDCRSGAAPVLTCNILYGNAGGDAICGTDGGNNVVADPKFCGGTGTGDFRLEQTSPAAPGYSACAELIGAIEIDCTGQVQIEETTWGRVKSIYR